MNKINDRTALRQGIACSVDEYRFLREHLTPEMAAVILLDADSSMTSRAVQLRRIARQGFDACINSRDPSERRRIGGRLQDQVTEMHTGLARNRYLAELYERVARYTHAPRSLPNPVTPVDETGLALHRWHSWRGDKWADDRLVRLTAKALINRLMAQKISGSDRGLLPQLAARCLGSGRADLTILRMGLNAMTRSAS